MSTNHYPLTTIHYRTMPAKIYYDKDADISLLKNKTIAILGYGSQGHGHAQNLRDSGCNVIVAELPGTANYEQAVKDGFQPISAAEATKKADIITVLLPDEIQGEIFRSQIKRQPFAGQRAGLLPRLQRPFRPVRLAQGRLDDSSWPPRAPDIWSARNTSAGRAFPA